MRLQPEVEAEVARLTGRPTSTRDTEDRAGLVELVQRALGQVCLDDGLLVGAPVAIATIGADGTVLTWNRAAETLTGRGATDVVGRPAPVQPTDSTWPAVLARVRATGGTDLLDVAGRTPTGESVDASASVGVLRLADGRAERLLVFLDDEHRRRRARADVDRARNRWRRLMQAITDTVTIVDPDGRVLETTVESSPVLGFGRDDLVGHAGFELIHPDDLERAHDTLNDLLSEPDRQGRTVLRTRHRDGHYEVIEYHGVNLGHDPLINGLVITSRNVTAQHRVALATRAEAAVLGLIANDEPLTVTLAEVAALVEHATDDASCAALVLDQRRRRLQLTASGSVPGHLAQLLARGRSFDVSGGALPLAEPQTILDDPAGGRLHDLWDSLRGEGIRALWTVPVQPRRAAAPLGLLAVLTPVRRGPTDDERRILTNAARLAAIAIERDRNHRALRFQAAHHHLSGLPNRTTTVAALERARTETQRAGHPLAVLLIDLDRFKVVNDSLGHAVGDHLLRRFGGRLRDVAGPENVVGHVGADEFVVLCHFEDPAEVHQLADRLHLALSEPFGFDGHEVFLSASIGAAFSADGAQSADLLIEQADTAMFRAKARGRARMEVFSDELRVPSLRRLRTEQGLRRALERDELELAFLPEIDIASGRIVQVEALLRWIHPERGELHPDAFLDQAESSGLILPVGYWVLDEALRSAKRWAVEGIADGLGISINLSARQFADPSLVTRVARALAEHAWPPDRLTIELTESTLIDDAQIAGPTLAALRGLGVQLALDDFGTGYGSLSYLHRFPLDVVKIDHTFVQLLDGDGAGSPVVDAIVRVAHDLGLQASAEGVETVEQLAGVRAVGADRAQGFLMSTPLRDAGIRDLLTLGARR
jgi:diguanylate cyclase (GGDEF)-like protein/PAS domain S-box-containing protein